MWPGQFSQVACTPQQVRRQLRETEFLKFFVAASAGRIIGTCELHAHASEKGACYVSRLAVLPDFQGKKFGKRLLLAAVNAAIDLGHTRIDLHTWPANIKAVPLYKKTGFYWLPDTRVYMRNYLPTIFADPIARRFFTRHDWYQSFRRETTQAEDRTEILGRKVFVHEWAAGREKLRVVIDAESGGISEISDGEISLGAVAPQEPIIGAPQRILWRFRKASPGRARVTLVARGEGRVRLDERKSFWLEGRRSHAVPFRIDPEIKPKADRTPHRLRTRITIAGRTSKLEVGVRPKWPVEVSTVPGVISLVPGQNADVTISLRSNLKKRARGRLRLGLPKGLALRRSNREFTIPREGNAGVKVRIAPRRTGVFVLDCQPELMLGGARLRSKTAKIHVTASKPGQVVFFKHEGRAIIENDSVLVAVQAFGAGVSFIDKLSLEWLGYVHCPEAGPPFWPQEFASKNFTLRLSGDSTAAHVELKAKSERFAGVTLLRKLTMTSGPLVALEHRAANEGQKTHDLSVAFITAFNVRHAKIVLPTSRGLVSEFVAQGEYPVWNDWPKESGDMAESWIAWELEGRVLGLIWEECSQVRLPSPALEISLGRLAPGQEAGHAPIYLYAGPGDWRSVQGMWQRYIQKPPGKAQKASDAVESRYVKIDPTPILAAGKRAAATISVRALTNLPLSGGLGLRPPAGWRVWPADLEFNDVKVDRTFSRELVFSCRSSPAPSAAYLRVLWTTPAEERELSFPFISLCSGKGRVRFSRKKVKGLRLFTLDNGYLRLRVSPDFMASLVGLEEGGTNHLLSAFPEPGEFVYEKPWYGGVYPYLSGRDFPKDLFDKEKFTCRRVDGAGRGKLKWQGYRLHTSVRRPGCKGLDLGIEYLTLAQSNVVAIRTRIRNRSTAHLQRSGLLRCDLQVGGDRTKSVLYYESDRLKVRRRVSLPLWFDAGDWAAVGNPGRKRYVAMVNASDNSWIRISDRYKDGAHLGQRAAIEVPPGEGRTFLAYLVVAGSLAEARLYGSLAKARSL